jgi:hypothetical protein
MAVDLAPSANFQRDNTGLALGVSFCCWARFDSTPAAYRTLLYHGTSVYSNCLGLYTLSSLRVSAQDGAFTNRAQTDVLSTSTWYFIGVTADTGTGNFIIYWRAEGAGSLSSASGTWAGTFAANRMHWGTGPGDAAANTHDGALAYCRAWDQVLTSSEMLAESAATADVIAAWGDWPMASTANSTTDQSGNSRTLTFNTGSGSQSNATDPTIGLGGGDATATPSVISRSFTLPAATAQAGSTVTATVIARSFTLPAAGVAAGAGPAVIARSFDLPAAAASGGGAATATPSVIALAAALPAATAQAGATVSPSVIARAFGLPAATASADTSATALPDVLALAFTLPAALATGELDFARIVALHHGGVRARYRVSGALRARYQVKGRIVEKKPAGSTEDYNAPRIVTPTDPTAQTIAFGFTTGDDEPDTFYDGSWNGDGVDLGDGTWAGRPITPEVGPEGVVDLATGRHRVWLEYAGQVRRRIGTLTVT